MEAIKELEEDREDLRADYQDLLKDFIESASKKLVEIGGPAPSQVASAHAKSTSRTSKAQAPIRKDTSSQAAAYTTPSATASSVVVPTTPRPSKVEKDLSGFGDADDGFEFEEID